MQNDENSIPPQDTTTLLGEVEEASSMLPSYVINKSNLYKILSEVKQVKWNVEGQEVIVDNYNNNRHKALKKRRTVKER